MVGHLAGRMRRAVSASLHTERLPSLCRANAEAAPRAKANQQITTADIQKLYRKLQKEGGESGCELSPATIQRIHGVLHQALDVAVNRNIIAKNPANDVTLPKRTATPKTILNDEQLERFMAAIKADEHWHDFFYLEITTGLRRGELCGLMWSDFDETERYANHPPNTAHQNRRRLLCGRYQNRNRTQSHQTPAQHTAASGREKEAFHLSMDIPQSHPSGRSCHAQQRLPSHEETAG